MTGGGERMARMKQKETKAERSADSGRPTLQALSSIRISSNTRKFD